jgi:hypothetical protein
MSETQGAWLELRFPAVNYDAACARSREVAAKSGLDHMVPQEELGQVLLRWIYAHMIEETARHAGHAGILREHTNGLTGVLGWPLTHRAGLTSPTYPLADDLEGKG